MVRFGYKSLLVIFFLLLAGTVPSAAYYYSPNNQPPGSPPNYNPIDPGIFYGVPALGEMSPDELGGYFVYYDSSETRWTIKRIVPFGTYNYEQFHGSILVQMAAEPQAGVNVWPEGFQLSDDLHRNDRWGWVKWPDSIAPNLYEIWWDITLECPEPYVPMTRTIGFWKNHTGLGPQDDLVSQFLPLSLGTPGGARTLLVSDVQAAYDVLSMSLTMDKLDGISKLYAQLLAAKLDIANGADGSVVAEVIQEADAFLADHDPSDWSGLDNETQKKVLYWKDMLDAYNNGYIGPGHEDGSVVVDCDTASSCPPCVIGISFDGCAFDFNLWGSSYHQTFGPDIVYLGEQRIPLSSVEGFTDTFDGIDDPYGHPFDCVNLAEANVFSKPTSSTAIIECLEPNLSVFSASMFSGSTFNVNGPIDAGDLYGDTYGGSFAYEGNGIEFSVSDCPVNNPPIFDPPVGYLKPMTICLGQTINDTIVVNDFDPGATVTLTKLEGPGDFVSTPGTPPVYGYYSWTPTEAGSFVVIFEATDNLGAGVIDSIIYNVTYNQPPVSTAEDTTVIACWELEPICYSIPVTDADDDSLTFSLLEGNGQLDPVTGELCFTPEADGDYPFAVEIADECGADTALFTISVMSNHNPWINPYDTIIARCDLDTICFDVNAFDPDPDDSLEINFISGPGVFTQTGNGIGTHCFLPDDVDSALYVFVYNVTDNCYRQSVKFAASPPVPTDSIIIIVVTDQPPSISCPEGTLTENLCGPDTICADISVEPVDAMITVVESGAVYENGKLCFYAEQSGVYNFTLIAAGECGADTCQVTFDVTVDEAPQLTCPPSEPVHLCGPDSISVPLGVLPESALVTISPEAEYSDGMVTFYAAEEGDYSFDVSAENGCGVDTCSFVISVSFDSPPSVEINDSTVLLCEMEQICIPFSYSDPDNNIFRVIIQPVGYQKLNDSLVCFTPPYPGEYPVIVTVLDSCGYTDTDTAMITVGLNAPPAVSVGDDSFQLCEPGEICLPVTMNDPDGNIDSIEVTEPAYYNTETGFVCMPVEADGKYEVSVTVYDECGESATDAGTAEVSFDTAPHLYCPPSGAMFLCGPDSISVPLAFAPASADLTISPEATYANGMLTFYAPEPGDYCFDVAAATACGADSCHFCISVAFDSPPVVTIADSIVYQCNLEEICLPYSFSDPDGNVVSVTVADAKNYLSPDQTEGEVCFDPSHAGINELIITVTDACGHSNSDTATVIVVLNQPPVASLQNATFNLCEPGLVCMPLTLSDPDGSIDSVVVMPPMIYDPQKQQICFEIDLTGLYQFSAWVYDDCGAATLATAIARVIINYTPVVIVPNDTSVFQCDLSEICLDGFDISDRNGNLSNIEFSPDIGTYADGRYCFVPDKEGEYCFVVRATDTCGAFDEDTVCVDVKLGQPVAIDCPPEPMVSYLCGPDSVCMDIPISPVTAEITIIGDGAVYENGKLCMYAEQTGSYDYTIIAAGECGADTCNVTFDVTVDEAPVVTCPPSDTIHLCAPGMIDLPLGFTPETANLTITPDADYSEGMIHFRADEPGDYCFEAIAANDCGADTCHFCITVTLDTPPVVDVPDTSVYICGPVEICLPITYSDPDNNISSVTVSPDIFTIVDDRICFTPTETGTYDYYVTVTDSCGNPAQSMGVIEVTMNQPPTISVGDETFFLCESGNVCLPVIALDPDGVIDSIVASPPWVYNPDLQAVCLFAEDPGSYDVGVTVYDDCDATALDSGTAIVSVNHSPIVTLPADTSLFLCEPQPYCFIVDYSDPDNNIRDISISPEGLKLVDGEICFTPDADGAYDIIVTVTDSCGLSVADTMTINVTLNQPPMVSVGDTTLFSCEPLTVCLPITLSDPEGAIGRVEVSEPAYYDEAEGAVCLPIETSGTFDITVTVYDDCGVSASDIGTIEATINSAPIVTAPADTNVFVCEPGEICLSGFDISDIDDNLTSIEFTPDLGTYTDGVYCFTPPEPGEYCFIVRATDECGLSSEDTVCVNYQVGAGVAIDCPVGIQEVSLCHPDTVCLDIDVTPAAAVVNVIESGAVYENGRLCFFAEGTGQYTYTLVAEGDCGNDTCQVTFDVSLLPVPQITCPADTAIHLCDSDSISLPIEVVGATQVIATPEAVYADGMLTFYAATEGEYCFEVIGSNECGSDTCSFCVTVTIDSPPVVSISDTSLFLCNLEEICLPYTYSDPDDNVVKVTVGPSKYNITDGFVCYTPTGAGTEEIYITVTDSCGHSAVDTATVEIVLNQNPLISVGDTSVFLCSPADLCAPVTVSDPDGSVDSIVASAPAYYDADRGVVCLNAAESGNHEAIVTVYDDCGAMTVDTGIITVRYNYTPMVEAPADTSILICDPTEVCIEGFSVIDIDDNLDSIEFIPDLGTYADGSYCFTPQEAGDYCFVIRATDTCGAFGEDTICVNVTFGEYVALDCPEGIQPVNVCDPQELCFDISVQPAGANVAVLEEGGSYVDGRLCFMADTSGMYTYTLIATGSCGADTCTVTYDVTLGELPMIACPEPSTEHLCGPDSISVPLTYTPADAELMIDPEAVYADGMVTFYADHEGEYCFDAVAVGQCGNDTCHFCVTVTFDSPPIVVFNDTTVSLCTMGEVCIPVVYSDPDNNIASIDVYPQGYDIVDGMLCFSPPEGAPYQFIITVTDSCGNMTADTGTVDVFFNQRPTVTVSDTTAVLCGAGEVCLDVAMSDSDGTVDSVKVSDPAVFDAENQRVCIPVTTDGVYTILVTVYDNCGISATDSGTVTVTINDGPSVAFGEFPNPLELCDLSQVCLPIVVSDMEDNIVNITGSTTCGGQITFSAENDFICWLPNTFGPCTITVIVTDACGLSDTATAQVELIELPNPNPPCPVNQTIMACSIDQPVCVNLGTVQPGSNITVRPGRYIYNPSTHEICYFPDGDRVDTVTVIDSTACGIDSCQFVLTTKMNQPPVITGEAPESFIFCHLVDLCLPYSVSDPDNNIDHISLAAGSCPGAVLDEAQNQVCLEITDAVDCSVIIVATDVCGKADTLTLPIMATPNQPPQVSLPDLETVVRCEDDNTPIEIPDFCVTDPNYDALTFTMDSGLGEFAFDPIFYCGTLTFTPPTNDSAVYCFRFRATDDCDTVYTRYCLNIYPALVCSTCVDVSIIDPGCVNSGQTANMHIRATVRNDIAAYDMLIAYDASALSFLRAGLGDGIAGWEYFTYRLGDVGNCESPCPSGLLRLVAIADINNGAAHPPVDQLHPDGNIASFSFRVSSDLNLGGQSIPIEFFWMDCGDNGFSDPSGQYLYLDNIIYSHEGNIVWDEVNDAVYPESNRPPHVGAPDECLIGDKEEPVRCVSLHNGKLCITHPDSVDARGDLNLNGIPYEIADAVVYTNYFISGLSAFNISIAGQIAASDVNADGQTLSIADLVYLVRIIIGDAPAIPKKIVGDNTAFGTCTQAGSEATISVASDQDIGGVLLVLNCEGGLPGEPILAEGAEGMEIKSGWLNGSLRVLIYSFEAGGMIKAGENDLIRIQVPDGGRVELVEMQLADYYGRVLDGHINNAQLPQALELTQNHPNPFNPSTTFEMALPIASDYSVTIYNITGQVVRRWEGHAEAGFISFEWNGRDDHGQAVASGMYFYRAQAAGAEAIRKMVLLK